MTLKCAMEGCLNEAEPEVDGTPILFTLCRLHRAKARQRFSAVTKETQCKRCGSTENVQEVEIIYGFAGSRTRREERCSRCVVTSDDARVKETST